MNLCRLMNIVVANSMSVSGYDPKAEDFNRKSEELTAYFLKLLHLQTEEEIMMCLSFDRATLKAVESKYQGIEHEDLGKLIFSLSQVVVPNKELFASRLEGIKDNVLITCLDPMSEEEQDRYLVESVCKWQELGASPKEEEKRNVLLLKKLTEYKVPYERFCNITVLDAKPKNISLILWSTDGFTLFKEDGKGGTESFCVDFDEIGAIQVYKGMVILESFREKPTMVLAIRNGHNTLRDLRAEFSHKICAVIKEIIRLQTGSSPEMHLTRAKLKRMKLWNP